MAGELDLAEIRSRLANVGDGPWLATEEVGGKLARVWYPDGDQLADVHGNLGGLAVVEGDDVAAFIAHARADIPALLAEVDRLRERRRA